MFDDEYTINGFLEQGRVLTIENERQQSLAMKISAESDDLAEEVCTILNIQKRLKEDQKHIISNVKGYGMLVLDDVDDIEGDS